MLRSVFLLAALLCATSCATTQEVPGTQTKPGSRPPGSVLFGLAAYGGTQLGESDATTLEASLARPMQKPVVVMAFSDESSLANALATGAIDAAWMPPLAFVEARSHGDPSPIAKVVRHGLGHYRSVIFARADRNLTTLDQLKGTTMAWVDHRSAAGYLFPRALLQQARLKPAELFGKEVFAGDHAAVCTAVLEGKADAGATFMDDRPDGVPVQIDGCVQAVGATEAAKLHAISVSKPIPNDVVAIRAGYAPAAAAALKATLLALRDDPDGKAILASVFKADGFMDVSEEEFGFAEGSN